MNLSKLKLLFIALFLCVNIYFVSEVLNLNNAKKYFTKTEISEAVAVLETKGVKIDEQNVLPNKTVPKTIEFDMNITAIEEFAKRIMTSEYGNFKIPDGQSFTNDSESLFISSDYSFTYENFKHVFDGEAIAKALEDGVQNEKLYDDIGKVIDQTFAKLESGSHRISIDVKKCVEKDGYVFTEAAEYIDGYEIEGADLVLVFKDERLVYGKGVFYFADRAKDFKTDAFDSINILFKLEESALQIDEMEMIYLPVSDSNTTFYLVPTYRFTYSDESVSLWDATSGIKR